MRKIVFYLSDHGFGHAARNIPIIEILLKQQVQVIVKTGKHQGEFIASSFKEALNLTVLSEPMGVGLILKPMSFEIDARALEKKVEAYIGSWGSRIESEVAYLKSVEADLVVCDIVPWVLKAGKLAQVKSCLISNFTWMEIYREYLPQALLETYEACYALADEVIRYDLATPTMRSFFKEATEVSVCAREFNLEAAQKIRDQFNHPIVFVSVGRSVDLAEEIDVSRLSYQFIVTEGIQLVGDNVLYLPKEIENTQDYIKASEMVITKAGFGTLAETMLAKKRCAVIGRESVAEDRATVAHLVERGLALQVEYRGGLDMEAIIRHLEMFEPRFDQSSFTNDSGKIANLLMKFTQGHYMLKLSAYGNAASGYLVPLDTTEFPFEVKRVFYLVNVPTDAVRGRHAYYHSEQVLICLHGHVKIKCLVDGEEFIYELKDSKEGLYLAARVWREAYDFSEDAVVLAVSSEPFNETDYRRG